MYKINRNLQRTYTTKGYQLISKNVKVPTEELPKKNLPKDCANAHKTTISTHFGKGLTTILSCFDKEGKLIHREIEKFTEKI